MYRSVRAPSKVRLRCGHSCSCINGAGTACICSAVPAQHMVKLGGLPRVDLARVPRPLFCLRRCSIEQRRTYVEAWERERMMEIFSSQPQPNVIQTLYPGSF